MGECGISYLSGRFCYFVANCRCKIRILTCKTSSYAPLFSSLSDLHSKFTNAFRTGYRHPDTPLAKGRAGLRDTPRRIVTVKGLPGKEYSQSFHHGIPPAKR